MGVERDEAAQLAAAGYLLNVAKDWAVGCFAAAQTSEFTLRPHRFELSGTHVRRLAISDDSGHPISPVETIEPSSDATAWSHTPSVTILVDHDSGTTAIDQEMVEVVAVDGDVVLAQAATVIRIPGLGVCLGPFGTP